MDEHTQGISGTGPERFAPTVRYLHTPRTLESGEVLPVGTALKWLEPDEDLVSLIPDGQRVNVYEIVGQPGRLLVIPLGDPDNNLIY